MPSIELSRHRLMSSLDRVRARTGAPLTFAGEVLATGDLALRHFSGRTVGALPGVVLAYDAGLGGRAVATRMPIAVNDYVRSERISHTYDRIIRAEGLRAMAAAPLIIGGEPVGVLYGAVRDDAVIGGRFVDAIVDAARSLEHEIVTTTALRGREANEHADAAHMRARLRAAYARLRAEASRATDDDTRRALHGIADELFHPATVREPGVHLTPRECDVVSLVAAGYTNRVIADRLGLTVFTVKGYLKSLMAKLHASTRLEAVAQARAGGIIP